MFFAESFSCPSVPIARVSSIAFLAMQIGMHPRAVTPLVVLRMRMGALPITTRIPPQSDQCLGQPRRRVDRSQRSFEVFYFHRLSQPLTWRCRQGRPIIPGSAEPCNNRQISDAVGLFVPG